MSNHLFGYLDMIIVAIPVTILCVWQLVSINREIARDKARKTGASEEAARHPVGEHREDDR